MLSVIREIFAPRFLTSIPGAVFWLGKVCLICAVWFAYVLARGCREAEQNSLPQVDVSDLNDSGATTSRNPLESYSAIAASAVYFGWHYAVDFYPALLLAWGGWWAAGRLVTPVSSVSGSAPLAPSPPAG